MQITGLTAGYGDSATVGRRNDLLSPTAGKQTAQNAKAADGPNAMMDLLTGVVSQYDLTDITPRDFSEMLRELRDAGALTESEYGELAQIRLDMDAENLDADDSINLLDFYRKAVDRARGDEGPAGIAPMERRFDWLEKVAILQESPEAAGLNALV